MARQRTEVAVTLDAEIDKARARLDRALLRCMALGALPAFGVGAPARYSTRNGRKESGQVPKDDTLFAAAVRYVDAWRSGPTKATSAAASRLHAVVDDIVAQAVKEAEDRTARRICLKLAEHDGWEDAASFVKRGDWRRRINVLRGEKYPPDTEYE